jgi:poly(3-hydroxybutyrate) depolymerase
MFDSGTPDGGGATSDTGVSGGDSSTGGSGATVGPDPVPSEGCGANAPASGSFTIDVQGTTREYVVQVPTAYDMNRPYKLVFAWHGLGGTATMTARGWFGLGARANDSAIFIAGQAQGQGMSASWAIHPDESDMDYTRAMLEWAKANYCIDTSRVFSIGVSNGGMMSNIVGCELGELFRAIAVIAGGGPQGYATTPCKGQVAAWITHGNQDNNVPFSYGVRSRDYWIGANHCRSETAAAPPDPCLEYQGCDDGFPVQFCEHDGGHTVPGFTGEAAWNFFASL